MKCRYFNSVLAQVWGAHQSCCPNLFTKVKSSDVLVTILSKYNYIKLANVNIMS